MDASAAASPPPVSPAPGPDGDDPPCPSGLSSAEAASRLATIGANELPAPKTPSVLSVAIDQFRNTITAVLAIAGLVTWLTGDRAATGIIAAVVLGNAVIGFTQQRRAQHALEALAEMTAPFATVWRDGAPRSVPATAIVPGDLIDVQAGDLVPSDAHLVEAAALQVDESPLTGESVPASKQSHAEAPPGTPTTGPDALDRIFLGTSVTHGRGRGTVVATGSATQMGHIADLLGPDAATTPLQRRLAALGRRMAALASGLCFLIFLLGVARGEPTVEMLVVAASVAVAAIPESLPAVVTVALALGAERMARRNAIVRRLLAVETLGSVTVICTDKTGTLTEGSMVAQGVWTMSGPILVTGSGYEPVGRLIRGDVALGPDEVATDLGLGQLLRAAAACNDASLVAPEAPSVEWTITGDPTEAALDALAAKGGIDLSAPWTRTDELPFDSIRRRMTTVHTAPDGQTWSFTKGAVEAVVELVVAVMGPEGPRPVTPRDLAEIEAQAAGYAAGGHRILALAGRRLDSTSDAPEGASTFYGLVALADPPRAGVASALVDACKAGIRPVMITGDHPETASAIAAQLGMGGGSVTGAEIAADPALLARAIRSASVFARISAEQKLAIVEAFQAAGEIVAMTGDGVNDAPALHRADIGVAMGRSGTSVSKAAADMVLVDDEFATIVHAVGEGRRIHDNIRRFVRYGLIGGTAEILVMLVGPWVGLTLPLLPVQILWINLLTHGVPGVALATEAGDGTEMLRPPRRPDETLLDRTLISEIASFGTITAAVAIGLGAWARSQGRPWQTMVFLALTGMQLGVAVATRSDRVAPWRVSWRSNRFLGWSLAATVLVQVTALTWPFLRASLDLEPLSALEVTVVALASLSTGVAVEARRRWRARCGSLAV